MIDQPNTYTHACSNPEKRSGKARGNIGPGMEPRLFALPHLSTYLGTTDPCVPDATTPIHFSWATSRTLVHFVGSDVRTSVLRKLGFWIPHSRTTSNVVNPSKTKTLPGGRSEPSPSGWGRYVSGRHVFEVGKGKTQGPRIYYPEQDRQTDRRRRRGRRKRERDRKIERKGGRKEAGRRRWRRSRQSCEPYLEKWGEVLCKKKTN